MSEANGAGAITVTKKRSEKKPATEKPSEDGAVRDPDTWTSKPVALTVRGTDGWKQWVHDFAEFDRTDVSTLVDASLANRAKQLGFRDPPKR